MVVFVFFLTQSVPPGGVIRLTTGGYSVEGDFDLAQADGTNVTAAVGGL